MWIWSQLNGTLRRDFGHVIARGYAGYKQGKNNPAMQHVKATGPIPQGKWKIGIAYNSKRTGPFTIQLEPLPETETFGRSAFRIHGDSKSDPGNASRGCIILPRIIRDEIMASSDKLLQVIL